MENKGVPVSTLENNPERSEYKLMCQVLGLYLEEPCNLQNYKEKEDYLYTFAKVFPQVWDECGLIPNERERERLQLTFDKDKFKPWETLKEQLRQGRVLIVFGRLNQTINQKTGGRSFSVYRLALMPENVVEIKDPNKGTINITFNHEKESK